MQLVYDETQTMLKRAVDQLVAEQDLARVRRYRDSADEVGFSWDLWRSMAELGWTGLMLSEDHGGSGLGVFELAIVLEGCGRKLMPEPLLSTVLLAGEALRLGDDLEAANTWLPKVAAGECVLGFAHDEATTRYDRHRFATTATQVDGGFTIDGEKAQVLDGHVAEAVVVSAKLDGQPGLYFVDSKANLRVDRQTRVDGRNAAIVRFESAKAVRIGDGALLDAVIDRATVGLCAEMLGLMSQAFDDTLAYLKTRIQFGATLGTFQALQHRAARMFIQLELTRTAVLAAARTADDAPSELPRAASLAKARANETAELVTNEAIQMHGGIGMTDEHDIGFYLKRARAADATFGDAAWHRRRWATANGY